MRIFTFLMIFFALTASALSEGYDPASFPSYRAIPAMARPWFANIAGSDFFPSEVIKLAKIPAAEPAMVELMQRIIDDPEGNPELLRLVIVAVKERDDFSVAHQAWLRELLLSKLGRTNGFMESILKMYGLGVFEKYPGAANEELMIQYLGDKNVLNVVPGSLDVGLSASAMRVLKTIGTDRALDPLRKYAEIYKPKPGQGGDGFYEETMESIAAIQEREKIRKVDVTDRESVMDGKSHDIQNQILKENPKSQEKGGGVTWSALTAVAFSFLSWLLRMKHKKGLKRK